MKSILRDIQSLNYKIAIIPIECLQELAREINELKDNNNIGKLQNWIINEMYVLDYSSLSFKPKSIVLTAKKHDIKQIVFNYHGKKITDYLSLFNTKLKDSCTKVFKIYGYKLSYKFWLPSKRLAVKAGICEYGRNNITYVKGWGSFFEHASFFSDLEPPKNYVWRAVKNMDLCQKCKACISACPTSAILKDRFLINPDYCISNFNEMGTEPFPDFIPKESHLSIVDCLICQKACPYNKAVLRAVNSTVEFNEMETELLLKGVPIDKLPTTLKDKIEILNMKWFYESIPRNLKALLYNAV